MTIAKQTAFLKGIESGKFETDKAKIYKLLIEKPMTLQMLILYGFPEKTASGRTAELQDLGLIKAKGSKVSFFYVVTDPLEQKILMQTRKENTYQNWVKKGESMGFFERYNRNNVL
jgi:hypothetical protein